MGNMLDKSGYCFQPRYAYINNSPGFRMAGVKFKGLIPALTNDFMALSPDKLLAAFQGKVLMIYL